MSARLSHGAPLGPSGQVSGGAEEGAIRIERNLFAKNERDGNDMEHTIAETTRLLKKATEAIAETASSKMN
jgi:hypothetical protein